MIKQRETMSRKFSSIGRIITLDHMQVQIPVIPLIYLEGGVSTQERSQELNFGGTKSNKYNFTKKIILDVQYIQIIQLSLEYSSAKKYITSKDKKKSKKIL
jgi:hypothetical protein